MKHVTMSGKIMVQMRPTIYPTMLPWLIPMNAEDDLLDFYTRNPQKNVPKMGGLRHGSHRFPGFCWEQLWSFPKLSKVPSMKGLERFTFCLWSIVLVLFTTRMPDHPRSFTTPAGRAYHGPFPWWWCGRFIGCFVEGLLTVSLITVVSRVAWGEFVEQEVQYNP